MAPAIQPERLNCWKDIAVFLNRGVRTVQRWEREEGLPVHRHLHRKRDTVFALASEIRMWLTSRDEAETSSHLITTYELPKISAFRYSKVKSEGLAFMCEMARVHAQRVRGEFHL